MSRSEPLIGAEEKYNFTILGTSWAGEAIKLTSEKLVAETNKLSIYINMLYQKSYGVGTVS